MKNILALFLFMPILLFSQSKYEFKPKYNVILLLQNGEKMINQCSRATPENIQKYFDLTENEIELLGNNFKRILSIKSTECCFNGWKIEKLEDYAFQYIGVIINNRKYIYINAFIVEGEDDFTTWYKDWKTNPIIICDGGTGFWGALFDLENITFSQLAVNGIG